MENKTKKQIAIALFTGAIIALFIFLGDLVETSFDKVFVLLNLVVIILISLKVILDPSSNLHFIGKIIRKILRINKDIKINS